MKHSMRLLALATLVGCGPTMGPAAPTPRMGTTVATSVDKTWTSVVDVFADRNIPIKTIDRSSGLIVAEPQAVGERDETLADCGKALGLTIYPTDATWNVRVRGDSTQSVVTATIRYTNSNTVCSSRGAWETSFESAVKSRAEGGSKP